ncbi:YjcQ family protein [Thermophilibacter sp.]
MAHDDFAVIAYKLLAYAYRCIRDGVSPSWEKAMDVAGCNPVYFAAVVQSLVDSGYLADARPERDASGDVIAWVGDLRITMDGVQYLEDNSKMGEVRRFLGRAFEVVLSSAVEATIATSIGGVA